MTNSEPFLPFPSSILPALLALRKTHQTIAQSRAYLKTQESEIDREKRALEADESRLRDQEVLTEALQERIVALQQELASTETMQPEDGARVRKEELRRKKASFDKGGKRLFRSLNEFIDKELAIMLAAEELGGPVVGELMDLDDDDLEPGFSSQGKLKKTKDKGNDDMRQQRLEELWRSGDAPNNGGQGHEEVTAAGTELKQLIQALVEQLQEAQGEVSASYVTLTRETASSRFLVRSKVAQLHPKDATKLRLIDFGRDLDS